MRNSLLNKYTFIILGAASVELKIRVILRFNCKNIKCNLDTNFVKNISWISRGFR